MKRFFCLILMILYMTVPVMDSYAQDAVFELYARSAVLMDGDSGRVLYGKEENTPLPMASTTKIMTCIIALEQAEKEMVCTVSANAAGQPKVKLGMKSGENYYLKDLLYSLMLESHNDTAVCIAENVAGSVENFAQMMNQKAREIGCENTWYITPNGLDAETENRRHQTTAEELALVMRYCVSHSDKAEDFLEITSASTWTFSDAEGKRTFQCRNHNALLQMVDGMISGKTGYTGKAGYCYVGALKKDGKFLIVSLLACGWPNHRGYKWSDSKKLLRHGLDEYELYELDCNNIKTEPLYVNYGKKDFVKTELGDSRKAKIKGLIGKKEEICLYIEQEKRMNAPVNKYTDVGRILYKIGDFIIAEYNIRTSEAAGKADFLFYVAKCADFLLL